jgi:N6-adenosine-specific RNA methylase IME4
MSLDKIKAIKIPAAPDCALWLWTTNKHLHEAFHIVHDWGFTYKILLTWAKRSIGLGKWLRGQTEHCILAIKGSPTLKLTNQSTLLNADRREHSRKPDEFYAMIAELCDEPRLDYFGREPRAGWHVQGTSLGFPLKATKAVGPRHARGGPDKE